MRQETFEDVADMICLVLENDYGMMKLAESRAARGASVSALSDELRDMIEDSLADAIGESDSLPAMLLRELSLGWGSSVWDLVARGMMCDNAPAA